MVRPNTDRPSSELEPETETGPLFRARWGNVQGPVMELEAAVAKECGQAGASGTGCVDPLIGVFIHVEILHVQQAGEPEIIIGEFL